MNEHIFKEKFINEIKNDDKKEELNEQIFKEHFFLLDSIKFFKKFIYDNKSKNGKISKQIRNGLIELKYSVNKK